VELNNRELALLIWLGIIALWVLTFSGFREGLPGLLKSFLQPVVFGLLFAFAAWVAGAIFLAAQMGLWETALINEAVVWFVASGGVLFFGATNAFEREGFLRRTAGRVLSIGIIAEVFVNLVVLPLWAELILVPVLTVLVLLQLVSAQQDEHAQVARVLDSMVAYCGFALFAYVAGSLILNPDQLNLGYLARILALPVWLTLASLPFIYLLALWMLYEHAFTRINFFAKEGDNPRKAKRAMLKHLRFNGKKVQAFDGQWQRQLLEAAKEGQAHRVMRDFQAEIANQAASSR